MNKIKKALIPAAGLGTRFLPATKTVPKEMFPIVDQPILLYIVEEAVRSGAEDIIFISGRGKSAIEDFFDCSFELEDHLHRQGKIDILNRLKKIRNMANFISLRQKEMLGLGHAVLCGQPIIGKENFSVLLGDEIMISPEGEPTATEQLATVFNKTGKSTVAVIEVLTNAIENYGVIAGKRNSAGHFDVTSVVEKPKASEAPSRFALPGRYVFTAEIFSQLKDSRPGKNGEIQLTDAMTRLAQTQGLLATEVVAQRYDAGDKLGYLIANIEIALQREDLGPQLKTYLQSLVKKL